MPPFLLMMIGLWLEAPIAHAAVEIARVNGVPITLEELNKRHNENQTFFQGPPPNREAVLEELIKRELGIQEARRLKLDRDPEVAFRMQTVLFQSYVEKQLSGAIAQLQVTDTEAKQNYTANPELRTSHIFVGCRPNATKEEVNSAYKRILQIQTGPLKDPSFSFSEVALKHSEGPAAPMGGDLDYQTKERLDPAYYTAALRLGEVGRISPIIRSNFGFHIIKLTGIKRWEDADRGAVKLALLEEKKKALYANLFAGLRARAQVTTKKELLK